MKNKKIHYNHCQEEVLCNHWSVTKITTKNIKKVTCQNCLDILNKIIKSKGKIK